jgi:hypothetical protein
VRTAAGLAAVLAGLLLTLVRLNLRERKYFDRPAPARHRLFDPVLNLIRWSLLLGGVALLAFTAPGMALALLVVLLGAWGYATAVRSVWNRRRHLRRERAALRRGRPGLPEHDILFALIDRHHPEWGEELIRQMVIDYPDVDRLARMVAKMERGFRGFRP